MEENLPGIGRRYDLDAVDGRVSVVVHHSGRRDLYVGSPPTVVTLDDEQARRLGTVLAGPFGLVIEWVSLGVQAKGAGRSIADLEVRRRTRMSIVAIVRGDETLIAPEPGEVLLAGDRLVVVGRPEDLDGLISELT
jgi:TrkA domain protein